MKRVKLKVSLHTRFMLSVTLLLIFLVATILFVIEKREVRTIFEESKKKGILIARNIANLNLQPLLFWDVEPIEKSVEAQLDEKLIYVIFYDRFGAAVASDNFIKDYRDIFCCSHLPEAISEESYHAESKDLQRENETLRILEIEIPIFAGELPAKIGISPARWGSIKIGLSLEDMHAEIRQTRLVLILIGCIGLLVGVVGAALLARRITRPIKKLVDGTVRISRGEFSQKIEISSQDEIGNLARSFNDMSHELLQTRKRMEEANRRLIQAEKLASIGRLSATIAHEIRNPLTSVKLNIQKVLLSEDLNGTEKEHLDISQEGISQIEKFIKDLLSFTRVSELNVDRFSVEQIFEEAVKMMSDSLHQKKVILERDFQKDLAPVLVDGDKMRQVFLNVLRNAFEAVEEGGKISCSLSLVNEGEASKIKIQISDNGTGIPQGDWENIFEPFYTTKPSGFGLGLANSRKIVEQHRGTIRVVKKKGKGTSFEILLPSEGMA